MTNINSDSFNPKCYYVFDFDDTIIHSNSKILVRDSITKEIKLKISPAQHLDYIVEENEYLDFSEFDGIPTEDFIKKNIRLNKFIFRIYQDAIETFGNDRVSICSARIDPNPIRMIIETLTELKGVNIAAIGSHDVKTNATVINAQRKRDYIDKQIIEPFLINDLSKKEYSRLVIYFYDDLELNIQTVNELNTKYHNNLIKVICEQTK